MALRSSCSCVWVVRLEVKAMQLVIAITDHAMRRRSLQTTLDILDGVMHKLLGSPQQNVEGAARYEWLCRRACLAAVPLGGHASPEAPGE
jgi:hypothetical protein